MKTQRISDYGVLNHKRDIYISPHPQGSGDERRQKNSKSQRLRERPEGSAVLWTWHCCCSHGATALTAAVVASTRPGQDQFSKHSSTEWRGLHGLLSLTEKLHTADGFWKRENQFSLKVPYIYSSGQLTMLHWMAPHPEVYREHKLKSVGY